MKTSDLRSLNEAVKQSLKEFTVDKNGNPVYPSNNDSVDDILKKHKFVNNGDYTDDKTQKRATEYVRGNWTKHFINISGDNWHHSSDQEATINKGSSPEELDKHLTDYFK